MQNFPSKASQFTAPLLEVKPPPGAIVSDRGSTVFVVDDDASVRKGITRLLSSAGYHTETFASAEEFLACSRSEGPGCLVLDVRLPGLNGLELQQALAAAERLYHRPGRHSDECARHEGGGGRFST
jgi:PleD family two-component response regulator